MAKTDEQRIHKSGPFKQENKGHKTGRHRSKGRVDSLCKGRIEISSGIRKKRKLNSKESRRNDIKLKRLSKREEVLCKKRQLGSSQAPPFFVTVVSLCEVTDPHEILGGLLVCDPSSLTSTSESDLVFLKYSFLKASLYTDLPLPRFKQRLCFSLPDSTYLYQILDSLKVSDTVIFVWPEDGQLSDSSETLLSCVFGQGLPAAFHCILNLSNQKKKEVLKKNVNKTLDQWFSGSKVHVLSNDADYLNLCRAIGEGKKKRLIMQERRPHLVAENMQIHAQNDECCNITLTGHIRGPPLNVNQLVHIPGLGDFQMGQIESLPDPHTVPNNRRGGSGMECEEVVKVLQVADPILQTSLQSEVIPDPMAGEQTWPTQEELNDAKMNTKQVKKVPHGTSDYQAAWIMENSDNEQSEHDSESESMTEVEATEDESDEDVEDEEDTVSVTSRMDTDKYDEEINEDLEREQLERFRKERENVMFPDEIDTPLTIAARTRFQKYRGLKSYRTSPWDPKENLPTDYSRIFQFQNFNRSRNKLMKEERTGALHGWYVRITVVNVPNKIADQANGPLILFGLFPHEHKMSMINLAIRKHKSCNLTVRNKDRLVFHVGFRRFSAQPIFSQHSTADKHKLERYLPDSTCVVASMYAPICFPPAPVLVFSINSKDVPGVHRFVGTGSLLDVRPSRVVVKRIVLSGHPVKINVKSSVVRYMFFNRDDILWFKPVQLRTKMGRRGHIKEPVGTHGHMKCTFDTQLNSQDTVLMNLYKRVYPKWSYDPNVPNPTPFRCVSSCTSMATVEEAMDN